MLPSPSSKLVGQWMFHTCRQSPPKGDSIINVGMQGGTHYEAAMRRAALMNTDDDESDGEEDGSGAEGSESEPEVDLQAKIDALSDDDAKEELKEAQLRKLMEDSQVHLTGRFV